jgi:multidrug resistance efflux pump
MMPRLTLLIILAIGIYNSFSSNCAVAKQSQSKSATVETNVELTKAREQVKNTQRRFETLERLSQKGSVSKKELRKADFEKNIALLDLSSLLTPARKEKNLLLKAKLIYQYRATEWQIAKKLYQRGAMNQVLYRRLRTAAEVARSNLKAVESYNESQRKMQTIKAARSRFELAEKEYEIAKKLFESGSINRTTMDRATSNLNITKSELAAAKKSLGASAVQVRQ